MSVSARSLPRTAYTQLEIVLRDPGNPRQVLHDLSRIQERVVVNIVDTAGRTIALSGDTLRAALVERPNRLTVQALPVDLYRGIMRDKANRVAEEAGQVRWQLRDRYVNELAPEITAFCQHLDQLLFLLHGYALQDWRPRITRLVKTLTDLRAQFGQSAGQHADNVRCMDDLRHEIVPALAGLAEVFQADVRVSAHALGDAA